MDVPRRPAATRSVSPVLSPPAVLDDGKRLMSAGSLFSAMAKRLSRKSRDEFNMEEDSGCSTDSCSSTGGPSGHLTTGSNCSSIISGESGPRRKSHPDDDDDDAGRRLELGSVSSMMSSDERMKAFKSTKHSVHFRSTSSIRRALKSISISTRSLSCSTHSGNVTVASDDRKSDKPKKFNKKDSNHSLNGTSGQNKSAKTSPPPKRILRQPVSYTYLKGMSGLPTQRIPRTSICCAQGYR